MIQYDNFEPFSLTIDDLVPDKKVRKQLKEVVRTAHDVAPFALVDVVLFGSQTNPERVGKRGDTDVGLVFDDTVTIEERDNIIHKLLNQLSEGGKIKFDKYGLHLNPVFRRDLSNPTHFVHTAINKGISVYSLLKK